jgi:hypothetical protein
MLCQYVPSVITVSLVESSVEVAENDSSTQLCVNVTHGNVESSASVRYSASSGTATGMLLINLYFSSPNSCVQ